LTSVSSELDSCALKIIREQNGKWIPARKNGILTKSYKEFDIYFYKNKIVNFPSKNNGTKIYDVYVEDHKIKNIKTTIENRISIDTMYSTYDYLYGIKYFQEINYEKALPYLIKATKLLIKDPELFYYRGLTYLNLGNIEKGCNDIKYSKELAEIYGYPKEMNAEIINQFLKKSCGE
jgi:tetratricopeptide (TPR) repeat protein